MTSPHEVKFALEQLLLKLSAQIVGVHSITCEGRTVFVDYDVIRTDADDNLLLFEFERPAEVAHSDLREFSMWLAQTGRCDCETVH